MRKTLRRSGSALMAALGLATAGAGVPGLIQLNGASTPIVRSVAEVLIVDSTSAAGARTTTAPEPGVMYVVEASGTYTWGPGTADAECSTWSDATYVRSRLPEPNLDLLLNGVNFEWTPVTPDENGCDTTNHTYRTVVPGDGLEWSFVVDPGGGSYTDNTGFLTVKIIDEAVESGAGDAQGRLDEVRGDGEDALDGVRDAITELTPSTLPALPTTTSVPDPTLPTVPDTTTTSVPDTTAPTVPDPTLPTVPDTTTTSVPDGEIGPGLVTEAVADVLDEAGERQEAAQAQGETAKAGALEKVGGSGLPIEVPPQSPPETSSTTTPTTTPTTISGPGPRPGPTPNPGSPPVGGTSVLDPGEDGGPGPHSETTIQTPNPDAVVAGATVSRSDKGGSSRGAVSASGAGLGEVVALDLPPREGGRESASVPEKMLRAPIDAARESPIGAIIVALLLLGATSVLSLRAFFRARFERLSRAYRYR